MMFSQRALAAMAVLTLACADSGPTTPEIGNTSEKINRNRPAAPLVLPASGVLEDGGTFSGTVAIHRFDLVGDGQIQASGLLNGAAITADGATHDITNVAFATIVDLSAGAANLSLSVSGGPALQQGAACRILFLDLGPIFLDLLGLQLDLSPIVLDLSAQPGPGNLLGNLLCAVVHLLDGPGLFSAITNLLNQINTLLGSAGL